MSAPLAGRFQDHYAILGVDPKTDSEVIQQAYAKLAQKYNPKTSPTGNAEKFEALNIAYEVLSDPSLRASFDQVKGVTREESAPKFSGQDFFTALGRDSAMRIAILCVLYDRRRGYPSRPSLSMRHLESILEASPDELASSLWYLKQRGLAVADDKSSLQITVDGMDFLEKKMPTPEDVMPFIKSATLPAGKASAVHQPSKAGEPESVLSVLNRALTRG